MFRRLAAAIVLTVALSGTASAGHHYYYSYPAYGPVFSYSAPVYAAPVYVPPVVVPAAAYYVPAPVYYRPAPVYYAPRVRYSHFHGYRPYYGGNVEVEVEWKKDGYEIEVDYDD